MKTLAEAKYRVLATLKDGRKGIRRERSWHDVEASSPKHAADLVGARAGHSTIHAVHDVSDSAKMERHVKYSNRVHDTPRDRTPAFTDAERNTLFGRAKAALGIKKKLPSFGGTIERK